MLRFIFRRVLLGIPVLVTVATLTFLIMHWVPGGPFDTEKILPPEIKANIVNVNTTIQGHKAPFDISLLNNKSDKRLDLDDALLEYRNVCFKDKLL